MRIRPITERGVPALVDDAWGDRNNPEMEARVGDRREDDSACRV